ncbi:unnamed protein product [Caenorhabditis auriculariae]|uniref:U5 small nuclear ribonucleoprotein 40 kDa protein n=1 Tax=Caenorhabditis auriculariae TaxID=2777116 RepID=A0A8S1GNL7_9PELO|nr:unnamed protein product [Caenorhabditis auriculariae]
MALVQAQHMSLASSMRGDSIPRISNLQAPIMLLNGHEGEIYTAQFSNDGTCMASAGYDMQIFLWNVYGDCENFSVFKGHRGAVMDVKFNTDSSLLISASTDKTVRVWDMETGQCARKLKSHTDIVNAVHGSRRGNLMIASTGDDGTIRIHDMRKKEPVKLYENRFQQMAVTFNDASDQVIVGGIDNQIKVWDLRRDTVSHTLTGHKDTITSLSLSPNGNFILSNSMDCSLRQWDVRSFVVGNRQINAFYGHQHNFEKNLLKCSWSADGTHISAGSADRYVYIWEVSTRKILYKLPGHHGSVNATDFHPKEPIILSAGSDKRLFLGEVVMSSVFH